MTSQGQSVFSICFVILGWAIGSTALGNANENHKWSAIFYPDLSCEFANGAASPVLGVADQPDKKGLEFYLSFRWTQADEQNEAFAAPDGKVMQLRLHHADGSVVTPSQSNFNQPFPRGSHTGRDSHGAFSCVFPWTKNHMQEAWLELAFPDQTYWIEIPYGFTRDPSSAVLPTSNGGRPALAPAMKNLPKNSRIVNWKDVFYKIGTVEKDFWVSLRQSNPSDARSQIILGREVTRRWDLNSPATGVTIHHRSGSTLTGRAKGNRLSESDSYRTDDFEFGRDSSVEAIRDWAKIVVSVGDRQWNATVPSSLFRHGHGVADPDHKATLK